MRGSDLTVRNRLPGDSGASCLAAPASVPALVDRWGGLKKKFSRRLHTTCSMNDLLLVIRPESLVNQEAVTSGAHPSVQ